jgi:MoxR-like ATPase
MLIKEHVLLKGKPGTAKSKLDKYSFGYITNAKTFAIQLSKFMSEEYLFGAIDINKMRNEGKVEHITAESVVDSEFAFIDEVFDGNDALLRSLLEVLNERTFTRHTQRLTAKLHTAIMTSNYVRDDEGTEAFLDRILFKSDVRPISSNKNRMHMYKNYAAYGDREHTHLKSKLDNKAISYEELTAIANFILSDAVELPEAVLKLFDMIIKEYSKQLNAYVSDRKANKMLNLVKACAVLNKRTKAHFEDIEAIKYALVTSNNDQQEEVFRAVFSKLMSDNVNYDRACNEIDKLEKAYQALMNGLHTKLNPKSKQILELNEEAQLFRDQINGHNFVNGSNFKDVDARFAEVTNGTNNILREIKKTLKLGE